jgi:hypothetical protein
MVMPRRRIADTQVSENESIRVRGWGKNFHSSLCACTFEGIERLRKGIYQAVTSWITGMASVVPVCAFYMPETATQGIAVR